MRTIPTFDAQAVTLSLAAAGPVEEAERDRLHELSRSSTVVEVRVGPRTREAPLAPGSRPGSGQRTAEPDRLVEIRDCGGAPGGAGSGRGRQAPRWPGLRAVQ